jgi:hypothetical protein
VAHSERIQSEPGHRDGWFVGRNEHGKLLYHFGGDPGFGSYIGYNVDADAAVVILANYHDSWKRIRDMTPEIWRAVIACRSERQRVP